MDLSIAAKALFSGRAGQVFEPFPSFFLKHTEIRSKRGNLDEIKKAQLQGIDVAQAKKTDEKNKDLTKMMDIFAKLPTPEKLVSDV